ncbi:FAD/NAD(P)-binding domain-containing protein [Mycena alexandri]|uniref:FAD/NAD(P)-binding domain-containing protein n=1 Tax=Mycena alexandri TaxID=1745969 RepID=A0AAD6T464_9AGAR|nr:FAD/NAD(P)-binding domain-containing protein [Mycena alexandri]
MSRPTPLNVAVVGAGLGGLSAAIALRRQGHLVKVFEASVVKKEIGAGIGIPPNAMRVLDAFGYDQKNLKTCEYRGTVAYSAVGDEGQSWVFKDQATNYGVQGCLCLRTAFHEELKRLALGEEGAGSPVELVLGTQIVDCDPEVGALTTKTGEKLEADVVIAADGIRSTLRTIVLGTPVVALAVGVCSFRWLADASKFNGRPELDWIMEDGVSGGRFVRGPNGCNIFAYPCNDAKHVNVTMIHPDKRNQDKHGWHTQATRDEVLEEYKDFAAPFKALIELVEEPVNLWQMRAVPMLATWTKGRLALLGDAAHATFPTLGQGAAMAVEDGATLGCMLPLGTTPEEVPSRLAAYQDVRKARGEFVNKESVEQGTMPSKAGLFMRSEEMQDFLNGYDAIGVSQEHFNKTFGKY